MLRAVFIDVSSIMNEKELFRKLDEIYPRLIELINEKCPDFLLAYEIYYNLAKFSISKIMRIYYAVKILLMYNQLNRRPERIHLT